MKRIRKGKNWKSVQLNANSLQIFGDYEKRGYPKRNRWNRHVRDFRWNDEAGPDTEKPSNRRTVGETQRHALDPIGFKPRWAYINPQDSPEPSSIQRKEEKWGSFIWVSSKEKRCLHSSAARRLPGLRVPCPGELIRKGPHLLGGCGVLQRKGKEGCE